MKKLCALLLVSILMIQIGCTTKYVNRSSELPKQARVGILMVDRNGGDVKTSMRHNYMYNTAIQHEIVPIAMNDFNMADLYHFLPNEEIKVAGEAKYITDFDPALLPSLKAYLLEKQIDYLMVMHIRVSALDERIQTILIKSDDMRVIGTKFYDYSIMKPLCIPLTCAFGIGAIVCPWFYLRDHDKARYEMVRDMLDEFMY